MCSRTPDTVTNIRLSAIILAAGKSTRMGQPKPLVKFRSLNFLETVIANFEKVGIDDIGVVMGHEAHHILAKLELAKVRIIMNDNYESGQLSSVQAGVRALPADTRGAFLALVDQPQVDENILTQIRQAFERRPDKIVIPTCHGKRGHPPLLPKRLFVKILSAPLSSTTSRIIRSHADIVNEVEVADERILWNINTPEDLRKALGA